MNYDNFWYIDYQEKRGDVILRLNNPLSDKISFLRGRNKNSFPLRLSYKKGKLLSDIVLLGTIGIRGYSPRIIDTIKKAGATGIEFFPLEIEGPDEIVQSLKGYHGAFITGTSGPILLEKSKFRCKSVGKNLEEKIYLQVGRFFDIDTWDGSDFFNPEGTLCTYMTERIVKIISTIKLKSVRFTPASAYENIILFNMIPNSVKIENVNLFS